MDEQHWWMHNDFLSPTVVLGGEDVFLAPDDIFVNEPTNPLKRKHEDYFEEWFALTPLETEETEPKRRKIEDANSNTNDSFSSNGYPSAATCVLLENQQHAVLKFTPKKKQTITCRAEFDKPVTTKTTLRILIDDEIFLRYGKRSLKPKQKSTLREDVGNDPLSFQLTGYMTLDNVKNDKDLKITTIAKKNERTFQIDLEPNQKSFEITLQVKIEHPQANDRNIIVLQLVNQYGTYLEWSNRALIQGSRRKTKSTKDSELSECFGPIWNVVDVELALLNKKSADDVEPTDDDDTTPVQETQNQYAMTLNDLFERAEKNMNQSTDNQIALELYSKYFEYKYNVHTPQQVLLLLLQPEYRYDDHDIRCFLRLADLYCRYNKNYQLADQISEQCLHVCHVQNHSQMMILRAAYRCAENDLFKGYTGLQYQSTIWKCERGISLASTMDRSHVVIKELESEMYNLKGVALSRMYGFNSDSEQLYTENEQVLQQRIHVLGEILRCKHVVFEMRQQLDHKSSSFAQICNNVGASLMSYYYLFRSIKAQYTARKAVSILNVVKRVQSRAVSIQKQANANTQHLAYALYKYRLKLCEYELALETKEAGEAVSSEKIEKAKLDRDKSKGQYDLLQKQFKR